MDLDAFSRAFTNEPEHTTAPSPADLEGETTPAPAWIEARAERMDRDAADRLTAALHPDPTETRTGWHGFTAGALQAAAGEDWPEVATRPEALACLALLLRTQAQRDRGEIPEHYTRAALCRTCGPVWLYEGDLGQPIACPWCMATGRGVTIPRPPQEQPR